MHPGAGGMVSPPHHHSPQVCNRPVQQLVFSNGMMRFEPYPSARPRLKPPPLQKVVKPEPILALTSKVMGLPPILTSSSPRPKSPPARPILPQGTPPQHHTVISPSIPTGPPPRQHHTVAAPMTPPGPPPPRHHTAAAPSTPPELLTRRGTKFSPPQPRPPSFPPPGHVKCLVMIPPLSARLRGALPQILHQGLVCPPVAENFE